MSTTSLDTADVRAVAAPPLSNAGAGPAVDERLIRRFLSLDDFQPAARRMLPRMLYGFVTGGVETNAALRENRASFEELALVPRALVDVTGREMTRELFGRRYAAPFGIAPMGAAAIIGYRADLAFAAASTAANIPMILSGASLIRMEEVRAAGPSCWYQAYVPADAKRIGSLMDRVAACGFDTFVLTVDVPVNANRENNIRNGYSLPLRPTPWLVWDFATHPWWLFGTCARTMLRHGMPHLENLDAYRGPPMISSTMGRNAGPRDALDWRHFDLIRRRWSGKLVIKGLVAPYDVRLAREHGADGVILSNHGGRQLDYAVSGLRVLSEALPEAGGMAVMLDGGVRRGTDVLKALAMGAAFVWVGRPFIMAAAVAGEAGVRHAIGLLGTEVQRDMALLGVNRLDELGPEFIRSLR
jgi:L-lactate dehydrogenase (cytochrome)